MLRLLTAIVLTLSVAGCKAKPKDELRRIKDTESGVTCWIVVSSGAISCLPDAPRSTTPGAP